MVKNTILILVIVLVVVLLYQLTMIGPSQSSQSAAVATSTDSSTTLDTASTPAEAGSPSATAAPAKAPTPSLPLRAKDGTYLVYYSDTGFYPSTIEIPRGASVRWTNNSSKGLKVITTDLIDHQPTNELREATTIARGQTFGFTFTTPYVYGYTNQNNPKDKGLVVVNP